jgi:integrase/recombinase XerD
MADEAAARGPSDKVTYWISRFLEDLAVVRSANTVRAYAGDVARWVAFCAGASIDPLAVSPRHAIEFVRAERARPARGGQTVSARTIVRRLSAVRQWYAYLALEPEATGIHRNPVPAGSAVRTGAGAIARQPALLRYDQPLPQTLDSEEIDRFVACLTATRYRDRALVWLLKDGGMRVSELLALRLGDIDWSKAVLTTRATKTRTARLVPVSAEAIALLAAYVRDERPPTLAHDVVFVNLGRRGFGQPFRYRSWVAVCERARQAAGTPRVQAHAFRHTFATNMAEGGMPLDTLKRVLGHRHLETVAVYNQVRDGRAYREYRQVMTTLSGAAGGRVGHGTSKTPEMSGASGTNGAPGVQRARP